MLRLLTIALVFAPALSALGLDDAWPGNRLQRQVALFDRAPLRGQLMDDSGPDSSELKFGLNGGLSLNNNAAGAGLNGAFDYYFTRFLSAGVHSGVSYGVLGRRYKDGGTAFSYHVALGAKFTFDLEQWEWSRWVRPWAALYPIGVQGFSVNEDTDSGRIRYSDTYYYTSIGGGVDFFLTSHLAIGASILYYGALGGSRHRTSGHTVRTRGLAGAHFEYARVTLRF